MLRNQACRSDLTFLRMFDSGMCNSICLLAIPLGMLAGLHPVRPGVAGSPLQAGQDAGGWPALQMQSLCPCQAPSRSQTPCSRTICSSWTQSMLASPVCPTHPSIYSASYAFVFLKPQADSGLSSRWWQGQDHSQGLPGKSRIEK